ncbi:MAG: hypothetical protein NUV35_07600 [Syntrophomonadaceae bacterium]|nr:hypothetical protein [Syntrophomonadaceae bacterium]
MEAASWLEGLLESVRLAGGLEGLWRYPWARVALMACARAEAGASAATRRDDLQRAVAGLRRSAAEARELADTARAVGPVTALARLQGLAAGARTPDWMRVEDWLGPGPRQAWEHQAMVAGLCLELDIPRGAVSRRALQALAETACLLEAAAEALEAGAYLARRHPQVQRYLETLPGLEVRDLQALKRAVADLASGVEAAMARLGSDPETGPGGLDRLVEETVAVPERALRTLASMPELQVLRGAGSPLEGLLAAADLFAVKLRYWRDRLEALLAEAGRARSTAEWLKREASSFFHLRQDVEGLLHPRSLRRAWSDLELSVTRYPLQVGQPLPAEVVPLLDSLPVQQRPVPAGQHLVVLEAHGDLYRVEVAGESRWEVPFLVVGRAG